MVMMQQLPHPLSEIQMQALGPEPVPAPDFLRQSFRHCHTPVHADTTTNHHGCASAASRRTLEQVLLQCFQRQIEDPLVLRKGEEALSDLPIQACVADAETIRRRFEPGAVDRYESGEPNYGYTVGAAVRDEMDA